MVTVSSSRTPRPTKTRNAAKTEIIMSIARAITRSPADAIGRSRTTASGVTTPVGSVAPTCTVPRVQGSRREKCLNAKAGPPACNPLYSGHVDIDRFVADNRSTWDRLGELTERVNAAFG